MARGLSHWRINCFVRAVDFVALLARDFKLLNREFRCGKNDKIIFGEIFWLLLKFGVRLLWWWKGEDRNKNFCFQEHQSPPLHHSQLRNIEGWPGCFLWKLSSEALSNNLASGNKNCFNDLFETYCTRARLIYIFCNFGKPFTFSWRYFHNSKKVFCDFCHTCWHFPQLPWEGPAAPFPGNGKQVANLGFHLSPPPPPPPWSPPSPLVSPNTKTPVDLLWEKKTLDVQNVICQFYHVSSSLNCKQSNNQTLRNFFSWCWSRCAIWFPYLISTQNIKIPCYIHFRVLSLKFCGKSKKICGDISPQSPAFCMYVEKFAKKHTNINWVKIQ